MELYYYDNLIIALTCLNYRPRRAHSAIFGNNPWVDLDISERIDVIAEVISHSERTGNPINIAGVRFVLWRLKHLSGLAGRGKLERGYHYAHN